MDSNYDYSSTYGSTQSVDTAAAGAAIAIFGGIMLVVLLIILVVYVYYAICVMKIAKKTNTENAWMAWIPVINIILMLNIAKKPLWWIILFFIPFANIVMSIMTWMGIAKAVGKPDWLGILMIIPFVNLIVPGYLAFSSSDMPAITPPPAVPAM